MYSLGVDAGASSVKVAALSREQELLFTARAVHEGDPLAAARKLVERAATELGQRAGERASVALTGSAAELVATAAFPEASVLEDVPAIVQGVRLLAPQARSIVGIGGQSSLFITGFADGNVPQFSSNEGCAAGTGSFFEDQMSRLGLHIQDYSRLVQAASSVPRLSGRCAVFAKTDIIHRQQEGAPVEDILLGLCYALVKSYKAQVVRGLSVQTPVALVGGVQLNSGVVRALRDVFKLGEDGLVNDERLIYAQAAGAALHALASDTTTTVRPPSVILSGGDEATVVEGSRPTTQIPRVDPLPYEPYDPGAGYTCMPRPWPQDAEGRTPCALGVDVGSTSTNLVLASLDGQLLDAQYLRTRGDAAQAVRQGMESLNERLGSQVRIVARATTGSGRERIGKLIQADVVRDEITAQARAAVAADPLADTVFEIGGQDSKYIALMAGRVADFQMNRVCAAGTGSFVEEQAARLGIPLHEYGDLAFASEHPVDLGERCTVFVESAINAALAAGADRCDIAAGLAASTVRNYLHRVVAGKPVGQRIVLQGGVAYNPAIVAAFRQAYGNRITVSPWFAVSGAVGVALIALEEAGLLQGVEDAHANRKPHECSVDMQAGLRFFGKAEKLLLVGYDPTIDPTKKTVGIPRALMLYKLLPLANAFFRQLGYNVVVSNATDEDTVRCAQETAQGETCYPVKLIYGHMLQLADAGVDYIFMPTMHTIRHVKSGVRHNYACPYMQAAPRAVFDSLRLADRGIKLISPFMDMDFGQDALARALIGVGEQLGHEPREAARGMLAGSAAVQAFTKGMEDAGEQLLNSLAPDERVCVILTRQYGVDDPVLNMDIPRLLMERGMKVITLSHLHALAVDVTPDHPGMCWPFGQHILAGAKLVRRDPRLFGVYLTNHGCGPDTMVSRLFAEEMGDKPYLHIEVDEHYSKVGVITRIEAFLNAIARYEAPDERDVPLSLTEVHAEWDLPRRGEPLWLPGFGAHADALAAQLRHEGYDAQVAPYTAQSRALASRELTTKEYLSFAALLGMALERATTLPEGSSATFLVPSSVGGEADSQYDRVVACSLQAAGLDALKVSSPKLERLFWALPNADSLFLALLAGDVAYVAPPAERAAVLASLAETPLSVESVCAAARRVAVLRGAGEGAGNAVPRKSVAVVGEWPLVYADELVDGLWNGMEARGFAVSRMPFSEYLWFLWRDAADEDIQERSATPFFMDQVSERSVLPLLGGHGQCEGAQHEGCAGASDSTEQHAHPGLPFAPADLKEPTHEEKLEQLGRYASLMHDVSRALGEASPFSADPDHLFQLADESIGNYIAGNGRYRAAKAADASKAADAVVMVASMYENTDIALRLLKDRIPLQAPMLNLCFDGTQDASAREKLASFLYYL